MIVDFDGGGNLWGTIPDWIIALTALGGVYFGLKELANITAEEKAAAEAQDLAAKAQDFQKQIARAELLLKLDMQFESQDLYKSRMAVRSMRNRSETAIKSRGKRTTNDDMKDALAIEFSRRMTEIWETAREIKDEDVESPSSEAVKAYEIYAELMTLPNFFETVGLLCKQGLLPKEDILSLYDQVIIPTMRNFERHFQLRREEKPYPNEYFMEHAMWLQKEAVEFRKLKEPAPAIKTNDKGPFSPPNGRVDDPG
ncbi:MAG: hypothetical protein QNI87_10180 [Erythrobacter sp.]|uniref:hypothetical protein n=1 Tax=Erythrobacter sp. TaxID=1042 RepID=UPI00261B1591|nr:hypothetical protein [Erythrobacter sp.]MDJ0978893.1 hypothetical protein [Erythrobacter sp.]